MDAKNCFVQMDELPCRLLNIFEIVDYAELARRMIFNNSLNIADKTKIDEKLQLTLL